MLDGAALGQLVHDAAGLIDGDGKANALGVGPNRRVYAYHL